METETLDKAYLEYSNLTKARTKLEAQASTFAWRTFQQHQRDPSELTYAYAAAAQEWLIAYYGDEKSFKATCKTLSLSSELKSCP